MTNSDLDNLALSLLKKVPDEIRRATYEELSRYSAKDLAFYFKTGCLGEDGDSDSQSLENKRMILRDYLGTTTLEFQESYRRHLDDELAGEI